MSIKKSLLLSASALMLAGTAHAKDAGLLFPEVNSFSKNEAASYLLAKVQFLPDYMEELNGDLNRRPGTTPHNKIVRKGCDSDYQTSSCSGSTPFVSSSYIAQNGDRCYKCRAFEPNDCEKDGYYRMEHWNSLKPQAFLNTPQHNMFTEFFGHILGIRNAHAATDASLALPDQGTDLGGDGNNVSDGHHYAGGGGSGSSDTGSLSGTSGQTLSGSVVCQISSRKILNEVVSGDYSFQVQKKCDYNSDYVKGEWVATCDPNVYKYDESNCNYILAGKNCEEKWDHCSRCSQLYSIEGNCSAAYPGVYDLEQAININDLDLDSCTKNTEGCLHSCSSSNSNQTSGCNAPNHVSICNGTKWCCGPGINCTDAQGKMACWTMEMNTLSPY